MSVSVQDLTAGQVADIEQAIGIPVNRWDTDAPSVIDLYIRILAAATGDPEEKYRAMKTREVVALVTLGDDDPQA